MEKFLNLVGQELERAFDSAGYDTKYAFASISNRPDLCEFQCNGAMACAKIYHKAPVMIAEEIVSQIATGDEEVFSYAEAVKPGFINLKVSEGFLGKYIEEMAGDDRFGCDEAKDKKRIIIDYGGPNVAKPLHVGHLRSAIIGESVKRIARFMGQEVIGDIHLGDWGLQMGLIITEIRERHPELVYFDDNYTGEYPEEAPFTISELEEIYPTASGKSKEDENYHEMALEATRCLQMHKPGYYALWKKIIEVSVADLKKNYERLNVEFDLWKGESDAQAYIPDMVSYLKDNGYAHYDQGALVVDVKEESDKKEIPPCMILKSNGSSLYNTTDLATMVQRRQDYDPEQFIYVVDKRQDLYFEQVFRCAKKTCILDKDTKLDFLGFGTMNGKDGKPFKTRAGGVMRLENLISEINEEMYKKIVENKDIDDEEARKIAEIVGLSAIKYGDLSNQASKDYVFDIDRFTSFEGDTGPYLLYTIVRIKSILKKYESATGVSVAELANSGSIGAAVNESEKALMLELSAFNSMIQAAYEEIAPHKICAYLYDLANAFNRFYHETRILAEEDDKQKTGFILLLDLVRRIMELSIDLLGFSAPDRM